MKIAIVGSRNYARPALVKEFVHAYKGDITIVSGGARGVDTWAVEAAKERGLDIEVINADWDLYGKQAGFIRNTELIEMADEVVAFWDGQSNGTRDTMNKARKVGKLKQVFQM